MKTISNEDISNLYKKVGLNPVSNQVINTNFNKGTLSNKLVGASELVKNSRLQAKSVDNNLKGH